MASLLSLDPTYKQKNEQYIAEDLSFLSDFDLHKICTEHQVFINYHTIVSDTNVTLDHVAYEFPKSNEYDYMSVV